MRITIDIEKTQPLTGIALAEGKTPVSFVGWMSLLRAISELTEALEHAADVGSDAGARLPMQTTRNGSAS
jgi:hypothetical protein